MDFITTLTKNTVINTPFINFQPTLLPRNLSYAGYRTGHIGKYHVSPEEIFRFDNYLRGNPRNAVQMAEQTREFISVKSDQPFFLYFATPDPHRGGGKDKSSKRTLKPDLFGNKPDRKSHDWKDKPYVAKENRGSSSKLSTYHGKSWLSVLGNSGKKHWNEVFASHTFHEIQMYYPMRVIRDAEYKLIWNLAHPLPYPFASNLWAASSFHAQYQKSISVPYGQKTVQEYIHRPEFEFFKIDQDPHEANNLAGDPKYAAQLERYKEKLKNAQSKFHDPWIMKWKYE